MTHDLSVAYPVEGGPSKWDLMLALFDRDHDVRVLSFTFGTTPLHHSMNDRATWSIAFRDPPKAFESKVYVIGVSTYVTKGDGYHIAAHVTVPRHLILGCAGDGFLTMLAEIYFMTDKRRGSVTFKMIPD